MKTSEECKEFIHQQIKFHESRAQEFASTPIRANRHTSTSKEFKEVVAGIVRLEKEIDSLKNNITDIEASKTKKSGQLSLSLTLDDIEGLPEEIMSELSISSANKTEFAVMNVLENAGGIMSLDQVIVGLYKMTDKINKRVYTTNLLYRMATKGLIFNLPNKKGVYSLSRLTEEEIQEIFGNHKNTE